MAEDSRRAPGGAALSKNDQAAPRPLDLRSWQGLTEVLQRGREAGLSASAYAEFRDLVLQYAQRGGDPVLLKEIETTINRFPKPGTSATADSEPATPTSDTPKEKAPSKSNSGFFASRSGRPTPTFLPLHVGDYPDMPLIEAIQAPAPPAPTAVTTPAPVAPSPEPIATLASPEPVAAPAPVVAPQAFAVPPVATVVPPPPEVPTIAVQPAPEVVAAPTAAVTPRVPAAAPPDPTPITPPVLETAPILTPSPVTAPPAAGFKTLEEHKTRIAEIKRMVNTKVGNPATLMDPQNPTGRDYMAALLSAMKASAGGGAPLDSAMQTLEAAHLVILTGLPTNPTATPAPTVVPETVVATPAPLQESQPLPTPPPSTPPIAIPPAAQPEPIPIPPPAPTHVVAEPKPEPIPLPPIPPAPVPETAPVVPETVMPPEPVREPETVPMPRVPFVDLPANLPPLPIKDTDDIDHLVEVGFVPPTEKVEWEKSSVVALQEAIQNSNSAAGWVEPGSASANFSATTHDPQELALDLASLDPTLSEITTAAPEELNVRQADLTSPHVTVALNQLLSEWSIFATSGLFGIGPGGAEHPLYRKLAALTMGEVLAGRWEKATPELRRTIGDYVNAWRHEQAVAYTPSETFEHYLRRVVYRILKRQRG